MIYAPTSPPDVKRTTESLTPAVESDPGTARRDEHERQPRGQRSDSASAGRQADQAGLLSFARSPARPCVGRAHSSTHASTRRSPQAPLVARDLQYNTPAHTAQNGLCVRALTRLRCGS